MKKVVLMPNIKSEEALAHTEKLCKLFCELGAQPILDIQTKELFENRDMDCLFIPVKENFDMVDFFVSIGGDGTLMHCAKWAVKADKPIVGVNSGRLGFLAHIEKHQTEKFRQVLNGEYSICQRMLLDITLLRNGETEHFTAVNDAVVSKGNVSKIIDVDVFDGREFHFTYRCDGVIFSTPTGSTAYSLSAGGPVIDPQVECINMTPICAHLGFNKSVLFAPQKVIRLEANQNNATEIFLTVDGEDYVQINKGDQLVIQKSERMLKLIRFEDTNFYAILNEKIIQRGN